MEALIKKIFQVKAYMLARLVVNIPNNVSFRVIMLLSPNNYDAQFEYYAKWQIMNEELQMALWYYASLAFWNLDILTLEISVVFICIKFWQELYIILKNAAQLNASFYMKCFSLTGPRVLTLEQLCVL